MQKLEIEKIAHLVSIKVKLFSNSDYSLHYCEMLTPLLETTVKILWYVDIFVLLVYALLGLS